MIYSYHAGTLTPSYGVYIRDTDGYYHTESEWNGSYTADCIAVITDDTRFGVALTESSKMMSIHSEDADELENYMTAIEDESDALTDYTITMDTKRL